MSHALAHRDRDGRYVLCGACGWGPIACISRQHIPEVFSSEGDKPFTARRLDVGDDPRAADDHLRFAGVWRPGPDGILRMNARVAKRAKRRLPVNGKDGWTPTSLPVRAACPSCDAINVLEADRLKVSVVVPGQFVAERLGSFC